MPSVEVVGETAAELGRIERADISCCNTVHLLLLYRTIRLLSGVFLCIVRRVMPSVAVWLYRDEAHLRIATV